MSTLAAMRALRLLALGMVLSGCVAETSRSTGPSAAPRTDEVYGSERPGQSSGVLGQNQRGKGDTSMQGIHDVTLLANNVAELRAFYEGLGFRLVMNKDDDMAVFIVGANEFVLHTANDAPTGVVGVSIRVSETESYESRLKELGVPFEGPKQLRPGLVGLHLKDPNGNVVELLRPASDG